MSCNMYHYDTRTKLNPTVQFKIKIRVVIRVAINVAIQTRGLNF